MPCDRLFVAIDVGTTGARACAVGLDGRLVCETRHRYATSIPRPGWAEQNPLDWRESALEALTELVATPGVPADAFAAIGLTGQCPTIAPFDIAREPVGPGLLYRDNRATEQANELRRRWGDSAMHARTGHIASAFHVGPKLLWLREHEPEIFAAADCFMQPRDVVAYALTGATATDQTHANSTMFFDLRARAWADDLLESVSLSSDLFPYVSAPWQQIASIDRRTAARTGLPLDCPVVIGAADSQCAAFGSDVLGPGAISEMAGASSCLNSVIPQPQADLRITHYSHVVPDCYCTELGVNVSGGALSWAVTHLALDSFDELETRAANVLAELARGQAVDPRLVAPLFLPYLGDGERDDPTLRAAFVGLSDRQGHDELAYSVLEGVAFAVTETVSVLVAAGSPLDELRVSGGATRLSTLGRIKAAALQSTVRHLDHDSAPVGAALLAASQTGFATEARTAAVSNLERARVFEPVATFAEAIGERYRWFLDVRGSDAVRLET